MSYELQPTRELNHEYIATLPENKQELVMLMSHFDGFIAAQTF
jgi:hypothetical protein